MTIKAVLARNGKGLPAGSPQEVPTASCRLYKQERQQYFNS